MAGSKQRATIQGHIVMAEKDVLDQLRRLPAELLRGLFQQGKEHGASPLLLGEKHYLLQRQSDHTFMCLPGGDHQFSL